MKIKNINRSVYDDYNKNSKIKYKASPGITKDLILKISKDKGEPSWMLQKRLKAFEILEKMKLPKWGPSLKDLNLDEIIYYISPDTKERTKWSDVPKDIKDTFVKLGIPKNERKALAGVGAQYESEVVYHNLKKELKDKGVVFENMDNAIKKYPDLVKKYFMTSCVNIYEHLFATIHACVFSGGTFIYVPENVEVELPLQAYFRMNEPGGGQFEHTLIIADKNSKVKYIEGCSAPQYNKSNLHAGCVEIFVLENAYVQYSSIENWSRNTYNLNTKRAIVYKNGYIEWLNGNMGSGTTMLYPCSILLGENSKSDSLGIAFSNKEQNQDTGSKVIHIGKNTKSYIKAKSIGKGGGITTYRGIVKINKTAQNSIANVDCDTILVDDKSISNTYPLNENNSENSIICHEAKVGTISDSEIFFLQTKGYSEEDAKKLIVKGFSNEIIRKLPLEYAAELNKLIELEMDSSLG